jgi:hypothetical protein
MKESKEFLMKTIKHQREKSKNTSEDVKIYAHGLVESTL